MEHAPEGTTIFVHGALANSLAAARELVSRAAARTTKLCAGTALATTWRLPEIDLVPNTLLRESLMVVQGPWPHAELHALEGLLPILARRRGGEAGVRRVRFLEGDDFWRAGKRGDWSWPLLAAALSRSHSPQGDALADGRTQDIVGLGLVPKLARNPRGWLLEHTDGLRSALLILDGVVADYNFALGAADDSVLSAQLFRAPPPTEQHYSRLTKTMNDFFLTGQAPWPIERALIGTMLMEVFSSPRARSGQWVRVPW